MVGARMKTRRIKNNVVVYQAKSGAIELRGDFRAETIWATQTQMGDVFGIERSVITKHIRNILKDKELDEHSVCADFAHTAEDGKTYQVQHYNLDVILAVGYRTNSVRAIQFRRWATKILREHITQGYTINRKRIGTNYTAFMEAVADIQTLLPEHVMLDPKTVLDLVKAFADTWVSLEAYDEDTLATSGATKRSVELTAAGITEALAQFKQKLMAQGEATDLFGMERQKESITGIVGNVMQSFGGKPVYGSVEEKAAHLLYFMVKNHPFADGNKRSGAYAFVWFLQKARALDPSKMTPPALTALTLFIAESDPKNKDRMVRLVLQLLKK